MSEKIKVENLHLYYGEKERSTTAVRISMLINMM